MSWPLRTKRIWYHNPFGHLNNASVKQMIQNVHFNRAYEDFALEFFQCVLPCFNQGRTNALGYAAFAFPLAAHEKAFLNEKLTWKQRFIRFGVPSPFGLLDGSFGFLR